jgi:cation diffusion facilitator family transporter
MRKDAGHPTHDHSFGQDVRRPGESRTLIVIGITAAMMVVEVAAGIAFGSMALLADGLHMGSHAAALTVTAVAYVYARRHANDPRYSFGTGKVNALGGFSSAVLLAMFSLLMIWESGDRFLNPVEIRFDRAILVAVIGLVVNGASALVLGGGHGHAHHHGHDHDDGHDHGDGHDHSDDHDHNLRAAYLHVLADALTSVLAIVALLAGKHLGLNWMDPAMGIVGAGLVARWSWGLLRDTTRVLLDRQALPEIRERIRAAIEEDGGGRVTDLHLWCIGPGIYAVSLSVVTPDPRPPGHYKERLPRGAGLVHATVEVIPSRS